MGFTSVCDSSDQDVNAEFTASSLQADSVALSPSVERLYIQNFLDKVTGIIYLANRSVGVCLSGLIPQYFYTQKDPQTGFSAKVQF